MNQESRRLATFAVALVLLGVAVKFSWDWISPWPVNSRLTEVSAPAVPGTSVARVSVNAVTTEKTTAVPATGAESGPLAIVAPDNEPLPAAEPAPVEPASRLRVSLDSESVHFNEAVVLLNTPDGYRNLLEHAGANATGRIPEILAVRVRAATVREIDALIDTTFPQPAPEVFNTDLNWKMPLANALSPVGPPVARPDDVREYVGITHRVHQPPRLGELGWTIDNTIWGGGTTIALLDTGVTENLAPLRGRVLPIDIGWGLAPDDRHGTALAAVAAGSLDLARGFMGVAPGARVLGVRVTAPDGWSDAFSVAQGIVAAANAGANVIAVSPTCPFPALVLTRAVAYARNNSQVAVVAARAEDLSPSWPAVSPGVFPVTAVDDMEAPVSPDGSVVRIVRAPPIVVPVVPGPDLAELWVRLDAGPASATTVAAALAAVVAKFPGATADQAWAALRQNHTDASFVLRPEGEGFSLMFLHWLAAPGDVSAPPPVAQEAPAPVADNTAATASAFLPGTTALDPATGRPRVTVIRTGSPTGSARGGPPVNGRAGARGGTGAVGAAGD
jgi:hypothetical protein